MTTGDEKGNMMSNVSLFFIGSFGDSTTRKELINANKIVLDLNNKIIFYEESIRHFPEVEIKCNVTF